MKQNRSTDGAGGGVGGRGGGGVQGNGVVSQARADLAAAGVLEITGLLGDLAEVPAGTPRKTLEAQSQVGMAAVNPACCGIQAVGGGPEWADIFSHTSRIFSILTAPSGCLQPAGGVQFGWRDLFSVRGCRRQRSPRWNIFNLNGSMTIQNSTWPTDVVRPAGFLP